MLRHRVQPQTEHGKGAGRVRTSGIASQRMLGSALHSASWCWGVWQQRELDANQDEVAAAAAAGIEPADARWLSYDWVFFELKVEDKRAAHRRSNR